MPYRIREILPVELLLGHAPGKITREPGAKLKIHEEIFLEWIAENIGGAFRVLRVSTVRGEHTADIIREEDGKLFDLKCTKGNLATLDSHIRRAVKQAEGGGAFVDISSARYTEEEAIGTIKSRMARSGLSECYLVCNGKLVVKLAREFREER